MTRTGVAYRKVRRALSGVLMWGIVGAGVFAFGPAGAGSMACRCQYLAVCTAEGCAPDPEFDCGSASATVQTQEPALSVCAYSGCWEGPAQSLPVRDGTALLEGTFRFTSPPHQEADIRLLLEAETGVGVAQISGDEGVSQMGLVCSPAGTGTSP